MNAQEDPIRLSPESYEVLIEDDRVRVLLERLPPAGRTSRHRHPDHLVIAISGGRIAATSVRGRIQTHDLEPGDTLAFHASAHEVENVGPNAWQAVIVEFKATERRD